jgi:hypothetical protein
MTETVSGPDPAPSRSAQEITALRALVALYWQDGENLRAELARIHASRSWRLTGILRAARQRIGL